MAHSTTHVSEDDVLKQIADQDTAVTERIEEILGGHLGTNVAEELRKARAVHEPRYHKQFDEALASVSERGRGR